MEPQFRSSFIPKKPISGQSPRKQGGGPVGLLFLLTLIAFLVVFALTAGVFLYQQFLVRSIERKGVELEEARAAFEPALIQELTRLDTRIKTADILLDRHIALSRMFTFLENNTIQDVRFTSFRFALFSDGQANLILDGVAKSFNAVALQSDIFGKSRFIENPIFEGLNVNEKKDVTFTIKALINPDLLSYRSIAESRLPAPSSEPDVSSDEEKEEVEETSN